MTNTSPDVSHTKFINTTIVFINVHWNNLIEKGCLNEWLKRQKIINFDFRTLETFGMICVQKDC